MVETAETDDVLTRWLGAMRRGDFAAAWRETDRIELPRRAAALRGDFAREANHLVWDGRAFEGQRVHVRCEHGLGDSIQFLRYLPRLREKAREVIVSIQPELLPLFRGMRGVDVLRNGWTTEPPPEHDVEIECMEFPYVFRDTLESLPRAVPYLPVEEIHAGAAAFDFSGMPGFRVGLLWAASDWDATRNIPVTELRALTGVPGCKFFSLQQGRDPSEAAGLGLHPLAERTRKILDAAAAMLGLDLIITVDGMAAHLAGALGRPVWVLLKADADWRWMEAGTESPWYPSARLFRQRESGDWTAVLREMAEELAKVARGGVTFSRHRPRRRRTSGW